MKSVMACLAAALLLAGECGLASAAEIQVPQGGAYAPRRTAVARLPRYVCNDYGRCWNSSLLTPEDYASGHLFLVNRVNRRAGACVGYRFQYPVGWDECLGDWDYGRGHIYH